MQILKFARLGTNCLNPGIIIVLSITLYSVGFTNSVSKFFLTVPEF